MNSSKKKIILVVLFIFIVCGIAASLVSCEFVSPPDVNNYYNITIESPAMAYRFASAKILNSVVCVRATFGKTIVSGSGTIISTDGYVMTNRHVACENNSYPRKPSKLEVDVLDENYNVMTYNAELVSESAKYSLDLAIIKITNALRTFTPASIAKASSVKYADSALMIGNSASTGFTAQTALIANPNSKVSGINFSLIKINADVNHGNSGGGLFNLKGDLIGIVTYRMEGTSSRPEDIIVGIGYALNTDDIKSVLLKAYPKVYEKVSFETYDDTVTEKTVQQ